MEEMNPVKCIKTFFEKDGGRAVKIDELRALSLEERGSLAELCAKELGCEVDYSSTPK